jgi:hypothetical protein
VIVDLDFTVMRQPLDDLKRWQQLQPWLLSTPTPILTPYRPASRGQTPPCLGQAAAGMAVVWSAHAVCSS